MHKPLTKITPSIFHSHIQKLSHSYPINFSESRYSLRTHKFKKNKFKTSKKGLLLWSKFLTRTEKSLEITSLFNDRAPVHML